jgi:large subunit ribosomal protein L1
MRLLHAFNPPGNYGKQIPYISLSMLLDIDTKRQSVRGVCQLPHGLKSSSKILVFCSDFDAQEMLDAGADFAGMNELLQRIGKGWTGFDRCIATPAVMPQVMKVAKILGPRKLMPNPKSGTLVTDLKRAIVEAKSGAQLEYRTLETDPRVEVKIGSLDAPLQANLENIKFIVREILKHKSRQSGSGAGDDNSAARLVTTGGISMIPNLEKLAKILNEKKRESSSLGTGNGKKKGLFIQSATIQVGDGPAVQLDPELILPSSPAYYR